MIAVDKLRMVEADGLLAGDPNDLLVEGAERRALISLYRLARCRPPETQQKKREWVREQLLKLTASKQLAKDSPPTSAREQGFPSSSRNQHGVHGQPTCSISSGDPEGNSLSVQHSASIPSSTHSLPPSAVSPGASPSFLPGPASGPPLHPGEGAGPSAAPAGHMVTANGYVSGRPPLPLTSHRVNTNPGLFQPRSLPNTTLDTNTLRWRSWTGQSAAPPPPSPTEGDNISVTSDTLYKLTHNEFKRLTDKVREYNSGKHGRYRGSGFREEDLVSEVPSLRSQYETYGGKRLPGVLLNQKVYVFDPHTLCGQRTKKYLPGARVSNQRFYCDENGQNVPLVHRSQLASSLKSSQTTFQDRKWTPYQPTFDLPDPPVRARSRPGSCISEAQRSTAPRTSIPPVTPLRLRPRTVAEAQIRPTPSPEPPIDVDNPQSTYDFLNPEILYALNDGVLPESVYGDRAEALRKRAVQPDPVSEECQGKLGDLEKVEEGSQETSHQEAGATDLEVTSAEEKQEDTSSKHSDTNSANDLDSEKGDSDDSDDENIPEPDINEVNMTKIPNIQLRPEKIDDLHVPKPKGDPRKYDFDMENVSVPPYEFSYPLADELKGFDFRLALRPDKSWRELSNYEPSCEEEEAMIDRLVEFERLQRKTEEFETQRQQRQASARHRARLGVANTIRTQTLKLVRENKKCTVDCVQPACVGDCPSKGDTAQLTCCLICGGNSCIGTCFGNMYEGHTRAPRDPQEDRRGTASERQKLGAKPSSCNYLSHTNASMARLKFPPKWPPMPTRGREGREGREARDARARSALGVHTRLEEEVSKLDLTTDADDLVPMRMRGRAGQQPGKSIFSQRRDSLTDNSREAKLRNLRKRARSAKKRRPKTAL